MVWRAYSRSSVRGRYRGKAAEIIWVEADSYRDSTQPGGPLVPARLSSPPTAADAPSKRRPLISPRQYQYPLPAQNITHRLKKPSIEEKIKIQAAIYQNSSGNLPK